MIEIRIMLLERKYYVHAFAIYRAYGIHNDNIIIVYMNIKSYNNNICSYYKIGM